MEISHVEYVRLGKTYGPLGRRRRLESWFGLGMGTFPLLNTIFCGAKPHFWAEGPITVTRQLGVGPEGPQPKLHPLGRRLESWFGLGMGTLPLLNTIFCGAEPHFWAEGPITVTRQLGVGPNYAKVIKNSFAQFWSYSAKTSVWHNYLNFQALYADCKNLGEFV